MQLLQQRMHIWYGSLVTRSCHRSKPAQPSNHTTTYVTPPHGRTAQQHQTGRTASPSRSAAVHCSGGTRAHQ